MNFLHDLHNVENSKLGLSIDPLQSLNNCSNRIFRSLLVLLVIDELNNCFDLSSLFILVDVVEEATGLAFLGSGVFGEGIIFGSFIHLI